MMRARHAVLLLCISCYRPFDPSTPRGATLYVSLTEDSAGVHRVWGSLDAGRTERRVRRIVAAPLLVNGLEFPFGEPASGIDNRGLTGMWRDSTRGSAVPLTVVLPRIDGLTAPVATLTLSSVGFAGSDTVVAGPDGSLEVRLRSVGGGAPVLSRRWSVEVVGAHPLVIGGEGLPPNRLVVPGELVPPPHAQGAWYTLVNFTERQGILAAAGTAVNAYTFDVTRIQRLRLFLVPSSASLVP